MKALGLFVSLSFSVDKELAGSYEKTLSSKLEGTQGTI